MPRGSMAPGQPDSMRFSKAKSVKPWLPISTLTLSGIESSLVGPGDIRVTVPLSELHDLRETTVRDVFALNRKDGW